MPRVLLYHLADTTVSTVEELLKSAGFWPPEISYHVSGLAEVEMLTRLLLTRFPAAPATNSELCAAREKFP